MTNTQPFTLTTNFPPLPFSLYVGEDKLGVEGKNVFTILYTKSYHSCLKSYELCKLLNKSL